MTADSRALLMLKPDAVRQGLTRRVDDWLRPRGFTPRAARLIDLTPELRSDLYATTRSGGALDWELNAILYTLGPVLVVLLDGDPAEHPSASQRLTSLKGDFRPSRATPGSLRADVGALNPIFNLVHTSDDPTELERELDATGGEVWSEASLVDYETQRRRPEAPFAPWAALSWCLDRLTAGTRLLGPHSDFPASFFWHTPEQRGRPAVTSAALIRARDALDDLCSRLPAHTASVVAGIATGHTSWSTWLAATSSADTSQDAQIHGGSLTDPWPPYLAYTTLRYLELCLGSAPATHDSAGG